MKYLIICIFLLASCVNVAQNKKYVEPNLKEYTGIDSYVIIAKKFRHNQSYLEVQVSDSNMRMVEKRLDKVAYDSLDHFMAGKLLFELKDISTIDTSYKFHFRETTGYGYYIIGSSKKANSVILLENFPELPPGVIAYGSDKD